MTKHFIAVDNPSDKTLEMLKKEAKRNNKHIKATLAHIMPPSEIETRLMKVEIIEK